MVKANQGLGFTRIPLPYSSINQLGDPGQVS